DHERRTTDTNNEHEQRTRTTNKRSRRIGLRTRYSWLSLAGPRLSLPERAGLRFKHEQTHFDGRASAHCVTIPLPPVASLYQGAKRVRMRDTAARRSEVAGAVVSDTRMNAWRSSR